MKFKSIYLLFSAFAAIVAGGSMTSCSTMSNPSAGAAKNVDWLFVQNSTGLSVGKNTITLRGVNPQTVCFSDRPERMAGHMTTAKFIPMWSQGRDSFLKNPPNATLSVFHGDNVESAVVTLTNPRLRGDNLTYDVSVLEGTIPKHSGPASLFIDVFGMPCTPDSYAGMARRRAYGYGGGSATVVRSSYYGPTVAHYGYYGGSAAHYGAYGSTAVHRGAYGTTAVHRNAYGTSVYHRR